MTVYIVVAYEKHEGIAEMAGVATSPEGAEKIVQGVYCGLDWVEVTEWSGDGDPLTEGASVTYLRREDRWVREDA